MNLTPEDKLILLALRLKLSDTEDQQFDELIFSGLDWSRAALNAIKNGLGPMLFKKIETEKYRSYVTEKVFNELKKIYYKNYGRNVIYYSQFKEVIEILKKENIDIIPLKGIFLAEKVYQDIGLRQLSDVDLLVRTNEEAERCRVLMIKNGYSEENIYPSKYIKQYSEHLSPLMKNGVAFELHTLIHRKNSPYNVDMNDLWRNAKKTILAGEEVYILSPNDILLQLCIHLKNHYDENLLQMKMFADIVNILDKYKTSINWDMLEKKSTAYRCVDILLKILSVLKQYLVISYPLEFERNLCSDPQMNDAFINVLQHNSHALSSSRKEFMLSSNIININREKGVLKKMKHLCGDIFPSRSYMNQNYKIKIKWTVYGYYLIRIFIGFYKLISFLLIQKQKKQKGTDKIN